MFKWTRDDAIAIPIMLLIVIVMTIAFHFLLKNKSEKIKNIPLHVIAGLLIALEIAKQIYFIVDGYVLYAAPIHFCSLIILIICLAQFLPKKIAKFFYVPSVIFSLIVLVLLLVHPHSMIGNASTLMFATFPMFHTFMFHSLVIAYAFFRIVLIKHNLKWLDMLSCPACILFYACYAVPLAFHFNSNYINILYSYFAPLESFRINCGQVAYDIVLFLIAIAVCSLMFLLWFGIQKIILKRREKHGNTTN